ncbi:MAG: hypothetical protein IPK27_22450 [Rhodanobacteraceae bacterium]|nr:hypothetical protein [Rhodanobacteraceae bacterium]
MAQEFRNRTAVFGWGFMIAWLAMLCAFTWILLRDGPPPQQPLLTVAVLALFWLVGVPVSLQMFARPIVHVRVHGRGRVSIRKRNLFGSMTQEIGPRGMADVRVVESTDSDGDPYFHARLRIGDGIELDLWEGHQRPQAEAEVARFQQALR